MASDQIELALMKPVLEMYVIEHTPTGKVLPRAKGRNGRGGSLVEPIEWTDPTEEPRLIPTKKRAENVLTQWLRGHHKHRVDYGDPLTNDDGDEWNEIIPQPHRRREDMRIRKVVLLT